MSLPPGARWAFLPRMLLSRAAEAVSGTLTGPDYDRVIAEAEARLARHRRIGVLLDLTDFGDITAEAAIKDLRYDVKALFRLDRFPREAIVTDRQWMHAFARIASRLLPFIEVRAFQPAEAAALAWVGAFAGGEAANER